MSNTEDREVRKCVAGPGASVRHRLRNGLVTVAIVVVILLGFVFIAARTKVFRAWVEEYLGKRTGLQVSVGRTRIGLPYSLVIEGIKSAPSGAHELGGVEIAEVRIARNFSTGFRVRVKGCDLKLMRMEDGTWRPSCFSMLGGVKEIEGICRLTESFRGKIRLSVTGSSIVRFGADSSRMAHFENIDFAMDPVVLKNGRTVFHYCLSVRDVLREDGGRSQDVKREWLVAEDGRLFEVGGKEKDASPAVLSETNQVSFGGVKAAESQPVGKKDGVGVGDRRKR